MKIRRSAAAIFAAAALLVSGCTNGNTQQTETTADKTTAEMEKKAGEMRDITTQQVVEEMGLGINLGNTFESCGMSGTMVSTFEKGWGSPLISQPLIQGYADAGFGVLRVPVAWSNMMSEDYTISAEYIARVAEVVDWALDTGMYVILNEHWDGGWWEKFPTETEECMKKYTRIWEQITDYFRDRSDKLMFESLNEEGGWDSIWNRYGGSVGEDKERSFALLNEINQKFVDIVRSSGGNNEKRHLLIAGYCTDVELTCDELFVMPSDPAGRCAVSVHYYTPSTFCILDKDASWGKARKKWGHPKEVEEMERLMDMLKERFVDNGVPVIVGEYGCVAVKNKEPVEIRRFNLIAAEEMLNRKMCPVLWDTTGTFYDRYFFTIKDEEFKKGLDRLRVGESLKEELLADTKKESASASNSAESSEDSTEKSSDAA